MTKFKDIILNKSLFGKDITTIPRSLEIMPSSFSSLWTFKEGVESFHKGGILDQFRQLWNKYLPDGLEAKIIEVHIDSNKIYNVNTREKVISQVSGVQLLDMDIEELAISRAIAKIAVPGIHTEFSPVIAFNINEKGDQVGFGMNVKICNNMTILREDHILSTYEKVRGAGGGYTKFDLNYILRHLKRFMQETQTKLEEATKQIEEWQTKSITKEEFHRFLGTQFTRIQLANHFRVQRRIKELTEEEKFIPINALQLSRIAVEAARPSYPEYEWNEDKTDLWKLINWGTEVIKFQNGSDSTTLLKANNNWVNLVSEFDFQIQ